MLDCIFCKIVDKEIPATVVYEDVEIIAFDDIKPSAKHHILIVPKKHIDTMNDISEDQKDHELVGRMFLVAKKIAKQKELSGYQLMFNVGKSAGQIIFHIHLHLMSNG